MYASCAKGKAAVNVDSPTEMHQLLKAFGLKGKVKTMTLYDESEESGFTIAFDTEGNYIKKQDYNGGALDINLKCDASYCNLVINDWKWSELSFSSRFFSTSTFKMSVYDEQNRPTTAVLYINDEVVKDNVAISYSGSDSHGNYTKIHFATAEIKPDCIVNIPEYLNVKLEYWSDDATMDDVVKPLTETEAVVLIKNANVKDSSVLTQNFRKYLDIEESIPVLRFDPVEFGGDGKDHFSEGLYYDNPTLVQMDESVRVPNIRIKISEITHSDSGESASIVFYVDDADIVYGNSQYDPFSNSENLRIADCVFENGKWLVDDFEDEVSYTGSTGYYGSSRKSYIQERAADDLKAVESGELERKLRTLYTNAPELNTYLQKVADFKKMLNQRK